MTGGRAEPAAKRARGASPAPAPSDDGGGGGGAAGAARDASASATPAPPGINEDDWFLPTDPPFKLPPRDARAAAAAAAAAAAPPPGKKPPRHGAPAAPGPRHPPPPKRWLRLRQLLQSENYEQLPASAPTFANMAAPPSTYPPKRYCDLTGFEAPYTDPKTGLRYASAQLFGYLRALPPDTVQARLALRRAEVVLK